MNLRLAPIGDFVEPIRTWNPSAAPDSTFRYVDLSAVDQIEKQIKLAVPLRGSEAPSRARQLISTGDILVSTVRPNLNGVAPVTDAFDGATASTGFCVLRPRSKKLFSNYLMHWVRSPQFIDQMVREATGASYPAVSDRIIKASNMPFPPLDEQRRIAAILDKADALSRKRKRTLSLLDSLTQSIFLETFGDPERNPKGWQLYPFSEVVDIDAPLVDPKLPQYMGLLHYGPDRIEKDTGRLLPALTAEQDGLISKKFLCNQTHILYSKIRPYLNKVALSDEVCLCSADVYPISAKPDVADRIYVWHLLRSKAFLKFSDSHSSRANIPKINREQLLGFEAPIPPLALQREFAQKMDLSHLAVERLASSHALTNSLFVSLRHRAFSGELE